MKVTLCAAALVITIGLALLGCKSTHEEGVKSSIMTQWTTVAADTETTTKAAASVLKSEGLKDVKSESTNVDGKVTGKKADDTKVVVSIKKVTAESSEVSVSIGTMGEPTLGADIAKKIKDKIEMK